MEKSFVKKESGVVININRTSLMEAKKRKKLALDKDKKIDDLERRVFLIEEVLEKILNKKV